MKGGPIYRNPAALAPFYETLQDIQIFVEDEGSEEFYTTLFSRLLEGHLNVRKVIPLLGRKNVEERSGRYRRGSIPSVFVVDGDVDLSAGVSYRKRKYLYRLPFYCIENALFCRKAAVEIYYETDGSKNRALIVRKLAWDSWKKRLLRSLEGLHVVYVLSHVHHTGIKNFKNTALRFCTNSDLPQREKIKKEVSLHRKAVISKIGQKQFLLERDMILHRIKNHLSPYYLFSGKTFLLPLLKKRLEKVAKLPANTTDASFKIRLAGKCDLTPLYELRDFILTIAAGA